MSEPPDYELLKTPEIEPPPPRRAPGPLWIVLLLIAAAAIAAYVVFRGRTPAAPPAATTQQAAQPPVPEPLGGAPEPVNVPPLNDTDPLVRELVKGISSQPRVLAWLTTDGLIRNFTIAVTDVAQGRTPRRVLDVLRPSSEFQTVKRGSDLVIDPRSYERYNALADAAASLDPAGMSRLYATLKPRIAEAYGELGERQPVFDQTLERAIVSLLQVPILQDPVRVEPHGIGYAYADPKLEGLTAAQKHLLRTGPRNVRIIQSSIRAIALALGIPPNRLPPPTI